MNRLGAALIAAAGLMAGLRASRGERRKTLSAEGLCRLLELMIFELERFQTPLPELFSSLAERTDGTASALCSRAALALGAEGARLCQAWAFACAALPAAEREFMLPLGGVLGRYGAQEQTAALRSALAEARRYSGGLRAGLAEKSRLYIGLTTAAGLLAAVLLW